MLAASAELGETPASELQRVRGPYPIAAGVAADEK
jgi:hypothetical protein